MQRLNAASCLLIALLSGAAVRLAAERVKVEVVQTHTGIRLGSCGLELETGTEPARSRCNRSSGTYSRELGFHCAGSRSSTNLPAESRGDSALFYDLRVIMPNARRLVFHCSTILDQNCAGFPDYPEETAVECSDFVSGGQAYKDCTATGPVDGRIGIYEAALHGDRMTIFGPKWRRSYMEYGTWQLAAVVAQDPKPMPQEPQPAAPQESKPAAPESSPAEPESTPGPVPET